MPRALAVLALAAVSTAQLIYPRDGHHHDGAPLKELNETEVTLYHAPIGPSYYTIDWDDPVDPSRHPGWLITHALLMSLAFFVCLPVGEPHVFRACLPPPEERVLTCPFFRISAGITLRAAKHPLHAFAVVGFYASFFLACAASSIYRKMTPNMYPGQVHSSHGYYLLFASLVLTSIDLLSTLRRLFDFVRAKQYSLRGFLDALLGRVRVNSGDSAEYIGLVAEPETPRDHDHDETYEDFQHGDTEQWANHVRRHSTMSEGTVFGPHSPRFDKGSHEWSAPKISLLSRVGSAVFGTAERVLVVAGLGLVLTGIVTYTGGCRQSYVNGCLAHLISAYPVPRRVPEFARILTAFTLTEGGIFFVYGLMTFARFLGWCAHLGWSWNRAPSSGYPTAEFVESAVIFLYGATNTWMERFGANPGDPFTTKQIEHIGIAVMFWFAGLIGMAVESRTIRRWLAALAVDTSENVEAPATYSSSFNPFPALVIGITGAAMAAHMQTYMFQVQIHELWGNLLMAFSVMRCLTYFFLWVSPPRSTLPSRPPTEALASFFLAAGGISFMFSTEELTIAAMRRGRDDIMMFAVAAVAITCLSCTWVIGVTGFAGWLKTRMNRTVAYRSDA
ncbi:hypothetical protein HMN09_00525300 [Mycena chlorophos]|uniref:Protein YTP1-like C-terminal domain-containing protein n=1 Tax=Mycena chlorophos TaxID=658473 RepID=A0A8H6TBA8_MYCCL|nr:hypothetical protein HMN09_00525300 [Mycena chlorophos]